MKSILVTGFAPFSGLPYNPSSAVLDHLPAQIGMFSVATAVLSVDTGRIGAELEELYRLQPQIVLHTGLALDRPVISIERRAVNRRDFESTDNGGNLIREGCVFEDGPPEIDARFPVSEIVEAIAREDIPVLASDFAGAFLCNQALYHGLHRLPEQTLVGFVHLPADEELSSRVPWAPLPIERQARAVQIALEVAILATMR